MHNGSTAGLQYGEKYPMENPLFFLCSYTFLKKCCFFRTLPCVFGIFPCVEVACSGNLESGEQPRGVVID